MNRLKKLIPALTLSAALLFTGCGARSASSLPDSGSSPQAAESIRQTEPAGSDSDISENTPSTTTPKSTQSTSAPEDTPSTAEQNYTAMTIDVNGTPFPVVNSLYCHADDGGDLIVVSGEYSGVYIIVIVGTVGELSAGYHASQADYGNTLEIAAAIFSPLTNELYNGITPPTITDPDFSVNDISGGYMNLAMSGTITGVDLTFNISGSAAFSDLDECQTVISELNDIAATIVAANKKTEPFTCTGCKGSLKCYHCNGDGTCSVCLGLLDHCISCGGTDVCQFCHGTTICPYCNGEGVMY
ncbi:MAG: hypothetical protein K2G32_00145 [Oscillospiraceae bacterium]|nr:hypothetical protein [Oscillospiraceae bacterium]